MFLDLLFGNPAVAVAWVVAIFISLTVHEFSHALVGKWRGDRTAEREGRLTLNPVAHIDPIGLIPLFLFGFGWAKPVPFNPYNLKNPKWDSVAIALAGPGSNLIIAIIGAVVLRGLGAAGIIGATNLLTVFLFLLVLLNLFLLFFNIVPVHPLDGSKLFFALFDHPRYAKLRTFVAVRGPQILMIGVLLAVVTNMNIFFFVSAPSFAACDALVGQSCIGFLAGIF